MAAEEEFTHIQCNSNNSLCTIYKDGAEFFKATEVYQYIDICSTSWTIIKNIGDNSSNACVYIAKCEGKNMIYALKITNKFLPEEDQIREFTIQHELSKSGYTTPVYAALLEKNENGKVKLAIVTDLLEQTVKSYIAEYLKKPIDEWDIDHIYNIIRKCLIMNDTIFFEKGYIHGDHHLGNFMFKIGKTGEVDGIIMIDFGKTVHKDDVTHTKRSNIHRDITQVIMEQLQEVLIKSLVYHRKKLNDNTLLVPAKFKKWMKLIDENHFNYFENSIIVDSETIFDNGNEDEDDVGDVGDEDEDLFAKLPPVKLSFGYKSPSKRRKSPSKRRKSPSKSRKSPSKSRKSPSKRRKSPSKRRK